MMKVMKNKLMKGCMAHTPPQASGPLVTIAL